MGRPTATMKGIGDICFGDEDGENEKRYLDVIWRLSVVVWRGPSVGRGNWACAEVERDWIEMRGCQAHETRLTLTDDQRIEEETVLLVVNAMQRQSFAIRLFFCGKGEEAFSQMKEDSIRWW